MAVGAGHLAPRWRPDKGSALAGSQVDGAEAGVTTLGGQLKQLLTCEQSLLWCLLSASSGCRFLPCFSPSPFHRSREIQSLEKVQADNISECLVVYLSYAK